MTDEHEPLTTENWVQAVKDVEEGRRPSGDVIIALTGPNSVTSPGGDPEPSETVVEIPGRGKVTVRPPASAERVVQLRFGYAGANSVDFTDAIAMEVTQVENDNVYLTKDAAEYLFWSLGNLLGKDMED